MTRRIRVTGPGWHGKTFPGEMVPRGCTSCPWRKEMSKCTERKRKKKKITASNLYRVLRTSYVRTPQRAEMATSMIDPPDDHDLCTTCTPYMPNDDSNWQMLEIGITPHSLLCVD